MHDELYERLVNCFKRVFVKLDRSAIPAATHESIAEWDSIAHVTLHSLIVEEFGIDIDFEEFDEATSFSAILDLIRTRTANVQP